MPNDYPDWTQAVQVIGGTVSITGTPSVTISGTPTVSISGTPTVNVGNTPAVTISSGTVSISSITSGNITIVGGQGGITNVQVSSPPTANGTISMTSGQSTATANITPDAQATGLMLSVRFPTGPGSQGLIVTAVGVTTSNTYLSTILPTVDAYDIISFPVSGNVEAIAVTITTQNAGVAGSTQVVGRTYNLFNTGVQNVVNSPFQPLSVMPPFPPGVFQVSTVAFGTNIAANANLTVLTGPTTGRITVWGWHFTMDPNNPATLGFYGITMKGSSSGLVVMGAQIRWGSDAGLGTICLDQAPGPGTGIQLGQGDGLLLSAGGNSGATDVFGAIYYITA